MTRVKSMILFEKKIDILNCQIQREMQGEKKSVGYGGFGNSGCSAAISLQFHLVHTDESHQTIPKENLGTIQ